MNTQPETQNSKLTTQNLPKKHYRLEIGVPDQVLIMLVGCGGTGSYAALHLAQLAYTARQENIDLNLVFIDPDHVEQKNIGRQNFAPGEIGQPKAVTLARRYSLAYGLSIRPVVEKFSYSLLRQFRLNPDHFTLVVGCVDNTPARREIHRALTREMGHVLDFAGRGLWWLDAGNSYRHGQLLLGNSPSPEPLLSPLGFAFALPLPSIQEPDLLKDEPESESPDLRPDLSCAELTALGVQSRTINKMMAGWIDLYCERLIISRDLRMMATELDQRAGMVYSKYITIGRVVDLGVKTHQPEDVELGEWDPIAMNCPECGGDLVQGFDVLDPDIGPEDIVFCPGCDWQMRRTEFEEMLDENTGETMQRLETTEAVDEA